MKPLTFTTLLSFLCFQLFSQVYLHPQGMAYYKEGTGLIENGEYCKAEIVLTEALNTLKDENVYMKRGIARLYQEDTSGFCYDMNMAANKYFNLQASLLYNDVCCKRVDTLYFDKYMQPAKADDFRYFEEIKVPVYDDKTIGILHDIKVKKAKFDTEYGRNQSNLGKNYLPPTVNNSGTVDIVAVYETKDSLKSYLVCSNPPSVKNLTKYNFVKNKLKKKVKYQFHNLKIDKNLDLTIYYELNVGTTGDVSHVWVIGTYPEVDYRLFENELNEVLTLFVGQYPEIKPATFNGKTVNFTALDSVTF